MIKKTQLLIAKLLVLFVFTAGIYIFQASLSPSRSQTQKVYDDFVAHLHKLDAEDIDPGNPPPELLQVTIEFIINSNPQNEVLKYDLNWVNKQQIAKSLRIMDLLQMANIFSSTDTSVNPADAATIKVVSSSGFKFEAQLATQEFQKNQPLSLVLAIMREIVGSAGF